MIEGQLQVPSLTKERLPKESKLTRTLVERLVVASAATKEGLEARLKQISASLEAPDVALADIAYTLAKGRKAMAHRAAVVLPRSGALSSAFGDLTGESVVQGRARDGAAKVALMFPGQGSQFVGMGRALYRSSQRYRETFDRCDAVLEGKLGLRLAELLLVEPAEERGELEEKLTQTAIAQPALFVVEYALADLLLHYGVRPDVLIGHSIGEFSAACLAGVFELEAALALVAERGRLMQSMPPGAMLAVKTEPEQLEEFLSDAVNLAAHNAPGLSVVSGAFEPIEDFRRQVEARGLEVRELHTSHAFHSVMMEPILDEFRQAVARANPQPPTIPIISTMTGQRLLDEEATSADYWARQLRNPVRFAAAARLACDDAARVFVEVGPGTSLVTSVGKLSELSFRPRKLIGTFGHPKTDRPADETTLLTLGELWIQGAELSWETFFRAEERRLVRLPTYPYQRRRHWIEPPPIAGARAAAVGVVADRPPAAEAGFVRAPEDVALAQLKVLLEARLGRALDVEELELKFLELGFDSLALSQLSGKVRQEFKVQVPVRQLFQQLGTPLLLARYLGEKSPELAAPPVTSRSMGRVAEGGGALAASAAVMPQAGVTDVGGVNPLEARLSRMERLLEELVAGVRPLLQTGGVNLGVVNLSGTAASPADDARAGARSEGTAELTASQREIWVAARVGGDAANLAYNECRTFLFDGELDREALSASLDDLCARHEALRQTFSADGSSCFTAEFGSIPIERVDLRGAPEAELKERFQSFATAQVRLPFDLTAGPLIRGTLLQLGDREHALVLCAHHVVVDGSSWEILIRELAEIYSARQEQRSPQLPQPVSFADYAESERQYRVSGQAARDEAFWVQHLKGQVEELNLPTDRPRANARTFSASRLDHDLDADIVVRVKDAAKRAGCTPQTFLFSAFQILLFRLSRQCDLICGVPTSGQAAVGMDPLVGHCVHVLPLRFQVQPERAVGDHIRMVHEVMLDGLDHQRATFTEVLPKLQRARDPSRPALIQAAFGMGRSQKRPKFAGLSTALRVVPRVSENFELYVYATENLGALEVSWSYNKDLFDRSTIELWQRCFLSLVLEMTEGSLEQSIDRMNILGPSDRAELIEVARGPRVDYEEHRPVHRLFAERAAQEPHRIAVVDPQRSYSYRELDERANQIAHFIRTRGVAEKALVAVCLDRSIDLVATLLAVWRAGHGYVPLDPAYPSSRVAMILEDSGSGMVLTSRALLEKIPQGVEVTCIEDAETQIGQQPTTPPPLEPSGNDTAYVIFTSGSTGRPKGVEILQAAFSNFIASMAKEPGFSKDDTILALTTISFDISGLELFLPLATGGKAVIVSKDQAIAPRELQRLLVQQRVTVAQATPATWQMMFDSEWAGDPKLKILCGGEAFPRHLAEKFLASCGEIWNVYGPTETTVWSTAKRVTDPADITIGRPIDNTTLYVLDDHQALVPRGAHGELWIGGDGVARGYWGRDDLTAERFIPNPFEPGERIYRTGDLARLRADGDFECLGRVDFQVKIRGFRIELGEVESAILKDPSIKACAVVARELRPGEKILAGYVVAEGGAHIDVETLRNRLGRDLPAYMVPSAYCILDALPMTPNKKVDRNALPAPQAVAAEQAQPSDDLERAVLAIWKEILTNSGLGVADNFYSAGGQSLMAIRLIERVNREFKTDLPVNELFNHPTVAGLSALLRDLGAGAADERPPLSVRPPPESIQGGIHRGLFCIQEGRRSSVPFFLIHGDKANGLLLPELGPDQAVWGYHHQGSDGERIRLRSVEELAQHCHTEWLMRHGSRPCVLGGHSFGALVAYHIAVLRESEGLATPRLVLIDARHPQYLPGQELALSPRGMRGWMRARRATREAEENCLVAEGILDRGKPVPLHLRQKYILGTYRLASLKYEPPDYSGEMDVIRSEEWTRLSPSDHWERSARGTIHRYVVQGSHLSIVREPEGVAVVGERLRSIFEAISKSGIKRDESSR